MELQKHGFKPISVRICFGLFFKYEYLYGQCSYYPARSVERTNVKLTILIKVQSRHHTKSLLLLVIRLSIGKTSRFNEPLYNEVLGIKNDILRPRNSKIYGKNLDTTKPSYSEHSLPVPWSFVISRSSVLDKNCPQTHKPLWLPP